METFSNFKSQCSVTKHIIPLIKLTHYTYEWYCLKTLKPQLYEVQSQQGRLWDTWNYKYTLDNPHELHGLTHCDYMNMSKNSNTYFNICAMQIIYIVYIPT